MTSHDNSGSAAAPGAQGATSTPNVGSLHRFENIEFDEAQGQLKLAGQVVALEPKPLLVLGELLRRVNEVVTKEELIDNVWDGRITVDHVLPNAISKLRSALGEAGAARIVTLPRVGYRLQGPVQRIETGTTQHLLQAGQEVPGRPGYFLERPLGEGARHDVWLARHQRLGQSHVFKFADHGARLTGLKREYTLYRVLKQELGQREDFATVLDSNFVSAPYFLECEYGGVSLSEWALQAGDDGHPRLTAMSQEDRLALFLQIAKAVAAAHSVGVLHKDIKPGNILIAGEPGQWQARLTDFGSGRLLDPSRLAELKLTALGMTQTQEVSSDSRSGTLMYMAPEVVSGQAPSMQSDVYALGLVLYQMLVGDLRRPIATGWERDVADELLRGDVAAATEGTLSGRISGVAELLHRIGTLELRRSDELELQSRLLQANIAAQQMQRNRARRPWLIALFGSLVVGLGASVWYQSRAQLALQSANLAEQRSAAVNEFLTKDVLISADLIRVGGTQPVTMHELLRRAVVGLPARFKGQPAQEAEVRLHLARTFHRMSSVRNAALQYETAFTLLKTQMKENAPRLQTLRLEQAGLHFEMNQPAKAVEFLEEAERLGGAALYAASSDHFVLAHGVRIETLMHKKSAEEALLTATSLLTRVHESPAISLVDLVEARRLLADVQSRLGDYAGSDRTIEMLNQPPLNTDPASHIAIGRVLMMRAAAHRDAGRHKEAELVLLAARDKLGNSPTPSEWHIGYAESELGHLYKAWERPEKAVVHYRLAHGHFKRAFGDDHQFVRITAVNVANTLNVLREYAAALAICDENRAWFTTHAGKGTYDDLEVTSVIALLGLARPAEALPRLANLEMPGPGDELDGPGKWKWYFLVFKGAALYRSGQKVQGAAHLKTAREKYAQAKQFPTGNPLVDQYHALVN
jgi:eukaryotic-like serine/threonine-protein kinase